MTKEVIESLLPFVNSIGSTIVWCYAIVQIGGVIKGVIVSNNCR